VKAGKKAGGTENYPHLPAMQPLTVEVEEVEYKEHTFNGKKSQKAHVRMRVIEGPYAGDGTDKNPAGKVWGMHIMTMNPRKGGKRSMLSELVIAARPDLIAGKSAEDAQAALEDFDLDELKPDVAHGRANGARLIVVGNYDANDAEQQYLTPIGYSSLPSGMNRVTQPTPAATAAPPAPGGRQYAQISEANGKRYGWSPGMTAWEEIVEAPAPPPLPPPAPAGPPPLPTNGAPAPAAAQSAAPDRAKVEF
jgi:hypothetical protein